MISSIRKSCFLLVRYALENEPLKWRVRHPSDDVAGVTYCQNFPSKQPDIKRTFHTIPLTVIFFYILSQIMCSKSQSDVWRCCICKGLLEISYRNICAEYIYGSHHVRLIWSLLSWNYIDGLVQDCSNSSALAMELLQSCAKSSVLYLYLTKPRHGLCNYILIQLSVLRMGDYCVVITLA